MIAGTIVSLNYLPQARVVSQTFLDLHPEARFVILVIDAPGHQDFDVGRAEVVHPAELGLPDGEWEQMAGIYSVIEFATSLKPAFLQSLLERDRGEGDRAAALYLDPDVVVYRPLAEVFAAARESGIALTPHVLHPLPRDGRLPDESSLMHAGMFNLGFVCVAPGANEFLDWWHLRVRNDAVVDLSQALFTDQRWVDWVPSLFPATILRDHGLNVAYWNLHERPLSEDREGTVLAGGEPLKFFHFSGFDPHTPWQLSKYPAANPRIRPMLDPILARLCDEYGDLLDGAGYSSARNQPYGLSTSPNGLVLDPVVRAAYRRALREASLRGDPTPPSPFDRDGGEAFARWLMTSSVGASRHQIGPWHREVWEGRHDLRITYPDLFGADALHLREWFDHGPEGKGLVAALGLPPEILDPSHPDSSHYVRPSPRALDPEGWDVAGYFDAELGVGEAGRMVSRAAELAGVPTNLLGVTAGHSRARHPLDRTVSEYRRYENSLWCVNADQLPHVLDGLGESTDPGSRWQGRRIGLWNWEVDRFPADMAAAAKQLDEIWTLSDYSADVLSAACRRPVEVVPLPLDVPTPPPPFGRGELGMPFGFVFLFSFDFHSVLERKNPIGLIRAYRNAFGPGEDVSLVVKSINGDRYPSQLDAVRFEARGRADIHIVDGYVAPNELQAMVAHCDCFVSLHRAEGFGLHLASAMAAGRPVVATGHSGNLTFMDDDSVFLVPGRLVPVGPGSYPYPEDARWAEPDADSAVDLLRHVASGAGDVTRVAQAGRERIAKQFSPLRAAEEIGGRLRHAPAEQATLSCHASRSGPSLDPLAGAGSRLSPAEADHDLLRRAQQIPVLEPALEGHLGANDDVASELAALQSTKTFRWLKPARQAYGTYLRRRQPRV